MSTVHSRLLLLLFTASSFGVALAWSLRRCLRTLHLLQQDGYSNARLIKWLRRSPAKRFFDARLAVVLLGLLVIQSAATLLGAPSAAWLSLMAWTAAGTVLLASVRYPPEKKKLVFTGRSIRLAALSAAICAGACVILARISLLQLDAGGRAPAARAAMGSLLASLFVTQMAPFAVLLSNVLLAPVQAGINGYYIRRARHRLRELAPRVVGITGSYGKTSTKFILDTLLAEKFAVLKTPESFNTLMGVSRTINENLLPDHRVLIVEMGAYRRGDVRELCEFVRPQIGIITAIGPQHLERFGSIEAIQAAKQELIESLPPSGVAILNDDDPRCRELADGSRTAKVLRYGTDPSSGGLRIWAEQVGASSAGLRFVLATNDGQRAESRCVLLGRHNVLNVLAASCAALEFGLRLEEVAQAIPKIQPVPHRLQLIEGAGGVVVIDDSYNSNPVGALGALEALSQFTTGRRVLVTPGMVELGSIEQAQNEEFGAKAARVCDYIILVGEKQTRAVLRGVERERFPRARVRVVPGLGEARAELQKVLRAGDVVLFENDLPDLYIEA